jgi:hypothetical protein
MTVKTVIGETTTPKTIRRVDARPKDLFDSNDTSEPRINMRLLRDKFFQKTKCEVVPGTGFEPATSGIERFSPCISRL